MFTLSVENNKGETLQLTQNESKFQIANITGLNPPKANIYTTALAGIDGERYKSSHLDMRNIVLTVAINGNVEENRLRLYGFFGTGRWCKLFYSNNSRDVYAEGYCETVDGSLFVVKQTIQISVICPEPYFKSLETIITDISKVFGNFEFPFSIAVEGIEFSIIEANREAEVYNNSEVSCGMIIRMRSELNGIQNPILRSVKSGAYLGCTITLDKGDVLEINTNKGQKTILKYVNGRPSNAINSLMAGSTWLQLDLGLNKFFYETTSNADQLVVEIEHKILYEGV